MRDRDTLTGEKPVAAWAGMDRHRDEVMASLTIILRSGGCRWGRCRMCGYRSVRYAMLSENELEQRIIAQLRWVEDQFDLHKFPLIKIYSSGSVFDPREVPLGAQNRIADLFRGKIVVVESRPEFVHQEEVTEFLARLDTGAHARPLAVAMGLETADDVVREKSIDKGFTTEDYRCAAGEAHRGGADVKTYLLHKPLFLTEQEAIDDVVRSIRFAAPLSEIVSLNPCTVQSGTFLEGCWKKGAYRPPYLWSVIQVLRQSPVHVVCDPVGGGHARGPHNCGSCDKEILAGIRTYSLTRDTALLKDLEDRGCSCREEWEYVLREERPYCMPLTR
ncbi:MAG: archaeosine biosynthesis radical SAM protein RaSEA [Methanomicrobiales archaeon]|nr:archaeosine biosynthesis radical SAM protein RaSEA [Methanomicrobiales archaeon]